MTDNTVFWGELVSAALQVQSRRKHYNTLSQSKTGNESFFEEFFNRSAQDWKGHILPTDKNEVNLSGLDEDECILVIEALLKKDSESSKSLLEEFRDSRTSDTEGQPGPVEGQPGPKWVVKIENRVVELIKERNNSVIKGLDEKNKTLKEQKKTQKEQRKKSENEFTKCKSARDDFSRQYETAKEGFLKFLEKKDDDLCNLLVELEGIFTKMLASKDDYLQVEVGEPSLLVSTYITELKEKLNGLKTKITKCKDDTNKDNKEDFIKDVESLLDSIESWRYGEGYRDKCLHNFLEDIKPLPGLGHATVQGYYDRLKELYDKVMVCYGKGEDLRDKMNSAAGQFHYNQCKVKDALDAVSRKDKEIEGTEESIGKNENERSKLARSGNQIIELLTTLAGGNSKKSVNIDQPQNLITEQERLAAEKKAEEEAAAAVAEAEAAEKKKAAKEAAAKKKEAEEEAAAKKKKAKEEAAKKKKEREQQRKQEAEAEAAEAEAAEKKKKAKEAAAAKKKKEREQQRKQAAEAAEKKKIAEVEGVINEGFLFMLKASEVDTPEKAENKVRDMQKEIEDLKQWVAAWKKTSTQGGRDGVADVLSNGDDSAPLHSLLIIEKEVISDSPATNGGNRKKLYFEGLKVRRDDAGESKPNMPHVNWNRVNMPHSILIAKFYPNKNNMHTIYLNDQSYLVRGTYYNNGAGCPVRFRPETIEGMESIVSVTGSFIRVCDANDRELLVMPIGVIEIKGKNKDGQEIYFLEGYPIDNSCYSSMLEKPNDIDDKDITYQPVFHLESNPPSENAILNAPSNPWVLTEYHVFYEDGRRVASGTIGTTVGDRVTNIEGIMYNSDGKYVRQTYLIRNKGAFEVSQMADAKGNMKLRNLQDGGKEYTLRAEDNENLMQTLDHFLWRYDVNPRGAIIKIHDLAERVREFKNEAQAYFLGNALEVTYHSERLRVTDDDGVVIFALGFMLANKNKNGDCEVRLMTFDNKKAKLNYNIDDHIKKIREELRSDEIKFGPDLVKRAGEIYFVVRDGHGHKEVITIKIEQESYIADGVPDASHFYKPLIESEAIDKVCKSTVTDECSCVYLVPEAISKSFNSSRMRLAADYSLGDYSPTV